MRNRVATWAIAGFLVAVFWAIFAAATFPSANERIRDLWILISVTCPVAMLRRYPVSLYEVLAANTITYALVGLMVEALRRNLHHTR